MSRTLNTCTIVITGASMGVGAAAAQAFARRGARLVLIARGEGRLRELENELALGERAMVAPMDVTDADAFAAMLAAANERFGSIDVLVNNAGYHARGPLETITADDVGRMIDVNLRAPLVATRLSLPYLRHARQPAVVNVASLAGRTPVPGSATYSSSKFGLRAFTLAMHEELRGEGIRFASVSPGPIDTGFIMDDLDRATDLTFSQPISTAEEVAEAIVDAISGGPVDRPMPRISGYLTTVSYLFPRIGRLLRPMLERKGARTKARLNAERGDRA
jgi:short-subunit dehydrogenase